MDKKGPGCLAIIVIAVFIGAILPDPPEPTEAEKAAEERALAPYRAQRLVKAVLRDPDSAEFRHVKPGVCGYVNSRNGLGGMTGYQRFIITSAGPVLEEQANRSAFNKTWKENCTEADEQITQPADPGDAKAVASAAIAEAGHVCRSIKTARRQSMDGSIIATCSGGERYRVFKVKGMGMAAMDCAVAEELGVENPC